jgi:hypothetical protein
MRAFRRAAVFASLLSLPALTPAHAQLGLANQMAPGYVVVPSPVLPSYTPRPAYNPPSYAPEPAYPPGVPRYLAPGSMPTGSSFEPGN